MKKLLTVFGLASTLTVSGCAQFNEINKRFATPYAASLGQFSDVATTAYAITEVGMVEGNPLLAGLNTGSVVAWGFLGMKPFIPLLYDNGWLSKPDCEKSFRFNGLLGWGLGIHNGVLIAVDAASATLTSIAWPIAAGVAGAWLLDGWIQESGKAHCANLPDAKQVAANKEKQAEQSEAGRNVWLD